MRAEQSAGFVHGDMGSTYWLEKAKAELGELA